jgi:hypothetical protein
MKNETSFPNIFCPYSIPNPAVAGCNSDRAQDSKHFADPTPPFEHEDEQSLSAIARYMMHAAQGRPRQRGALHGEALRD